jgi:hypothetical protein
MKIEKITSKLMAYSKKSTKRKVYKYLHWKRRKISDKKLNFTSQGMRKRRKKSPKLAKERKY